MASGGGHATLRTAEDGVDSRNERGNPNRRPTSPKRPAKQNNTGAFTGSFAGTARRITETPTRPWYQRRAYFTQGWTDMNIWKAAVSPATLVVNDSQLLIQVTESVAAMMLCYLSGSFGVTIENYGIKQLAAYIGIFNTVLLSVFIYATAPSSGGHINPLITWATFWSGLCTAPRAVLYIVFQVLGSALAGGLLRGSWGYQRAASHMGGGCFFDPAILSLGQVFLTEMTSSAILLFLAFGTGLDPRQAQVFGPQLGPLLVGLSLGLVTAATSGIATGYAGANMFPTRCLALAIARGSFPCEPLMTIVKICLRDFDERPLTRLILDQWIWWLAPAVGGILVPLLYNFIPPYHAEQAKERISQPDASEAN